MRLCSVLSALLATAALLGAKAQEPAAGPKSIYDVPADLVVPAVVAAQPAAGRRVRATTSGWEQTSVYHTLYLPPDWTPDASLPVIVEFPGNGGYRQGRDVSHGTPDACCLGYGLSGGRGAIWVCLPFVDSQSGPPQNCTVWWGDIDASQQYCQATVRDVCREYGGDSRRVVLAGFSRRRIACNFIGLHDDTFASLWCGFFCHSHYDGVRADWPYAEADRESARRRLDRLQGRPQWISHESSIEATRHYLEGTGIAGRFTLVAIPFPNHTDQWVLRDLTVREQARTWFREVTDR